MSLWDLGALARAAGSEVCGGALPVSVEAVGTDSRSLPPASLFVALRGERFDGHAFVRAAAEKGARAVMVDKRGNVELSELSVPRLVVADTLVGLGDMARFARKSIGRPVVAITGSNGKTTTKEMLAAILAERGAVHRTSGNLNNLIGLPLTVFAWPDEAWAAVLEMGMSEPGEIRRLCEIGSPDVGVITMVGPAHLGSFGSVEGIARAKGELFEGLGPSAIAIVNQDDEILQKVAVPLLGKKRRITFGSKAPADIQVVSHAQGDDGLALRLEISGEEIETTVPLVGPHNAWNAAAAAGAAWALGMTREEIALGLAKVSVPGGRFRVLRNLARGVNLVDDTYNANPASMRAAFLALASVTKARRIAVLGDMLELGPNASALHREVGRAAASSGIELVLTIGEHAADTVSGVALAGGKAERFGDLDALVARLDETARPGDWILVKGSRGMKMERVVHHFEESKA